MAETVKTNGLMGFYYDVELGSIINTPAEVLDKGWYVVSTKAATSGFPGETAEGDAIKIGDPFYSGGTITLADGDACYPLNPVKEYSISTWEMSIDRDTGTGTTFSDVEDSTIQIQMVGLSTVNGTMNGVNTVNDTDKKGGIIGSVFPLIHVDGETNATRIDADDSTRLGIFCTQKFVTQGGIAIPTTFLISPFKFSSLSLSADASSADGSPLDLGFIIATHPYVNTVHVSAENVDSLKDLAAAYAAP